jgi:hypothetical protein
MMDRPKDEDLLNGWFTADCGCDDPKLCNHCDGYGWVYKNKSHDGHLSEMMRSAMERHG